MILTPEKTQRVREGLKKFKADLQVAGIECQDLEGILLRAEEGIDPDQSDALILKAAFEVFQKLLDRNRAIGFVQ
jgi:hypothetical protein